MIFVHLLLGAILGLTFGHSLLFILGSILPDIDHIYVMLKNQLWRPKKFIDSIRFEEEYKIRYKTPLIHSILGLIIFSLIVFLINKNWIFFSMAYFLHLLIDWLDIDKKYYLYPLKIEFKGFLPIWSRTEKILTGVLIVILVILLI